MDTMLQNLEVWKLAWAGHSSLGFWWLAFQQHQWSRGNFFHLDFHSMRGNNDRDIKRGQRCPTLWNVLCGPCEKMDMLCLLHLLRWLILMDKETTCFRHSCSVRQGLCVLVCLPCWVLSSLSRHEENQQTFIGPATLILAPSQNCGCPSSKWTDTSSHLVFA